MADLEAVYREHRVELMRLAYLLCGSPEASEDAVQSAFTSAQVHWQRIDEPLAYLRRAVVNLVKGGQRRAFRRAERVIPVKPEAVLPPEVDDTWAALSHLGKNQRTVLVLHYYVDLPLVEIADLLDRPAATVRSDHRRALDALRKVLR